ncbi:MAG TPA: LysR substrate-binding domain-containing protein [Ferrovibrio sp.]|jgi:DNA-binding transcriptional LysR family regulator|uniref:LysR substrate-binding domain-containing protein n=1 Tax=Ferrovibrio sp. TaxID=1917215 RepID=UPI002ED4239A
MEAEAIALQRQASGAAGQLQGSVRLAAPPVVASHFIAPRLVDLRKSHPGIRLELIGGKDSANLSRREADLAVRLLKPADSGLIARRLGLLAYGLYAARDYLRRRKPETFDYLGYDDSLDHVPQQRWLLRQAEGRPLAFAANDLASLYLATRSGLGVAALPHFLGAADAKLVCLAQAGAAADREVWLLVHPDLRRAPRVRAAMDYLIALFEREKPLLAGKAAA